MERLVKIMVCAALVGSVFWTAALSKQHNADYTGPGPMSIGISVATNMGPEPMTIGDDQLKDAIFETPRQHGIVSYTA
ncbi:hypothetical protein CBW65_18550 [Tumebacillus avium]|uniref:Uncharacterized protein n=1 Tax=Tumebacillus avium TaxID=1903704 RepID=A0A1Y0ITM1_9BACL|nr:hypothetical protein CBW65_18550 [Tumebacillus avium]